MWFVAFAALVAVPPPAPLDLDTVLARARPAPEHLAAVAMLADAARELSLSHGVLLDGPTLAVEGGPRRSPEGYDSDLALGVDLRLAGDRAEHAAAVAAFENAARLLPAAAALQGELALRFAYLEAWSAAERAALAERDAEAAERWLGALRHRVEAGANAAYESVLVETEVASARLEVAAAREERRRAWGELAARAEMAPEPSALAEPGTTDREPILPIVDVSTRAVLARAITARVDLERSLVALEAARAASRFSLVGAVEREEGEEVARIGLGYRLPLGGERAARARALDAALARAERDEEIERVQLAARLAAAAERAASIGAVEAPTPAAIERALAALDARLAAGKDRPSEILPARRQLYGALVTALEARVARLRLAYELETLTRETLP